MSSSPYNSYCKLFQALSYMCIAITSMQAQVNNYGDMYIPSGGNVFVNSNYTNSSGASYLNDGNFYVSGNFTNNQTSLPAGTGTTYFTGTSLQNINGTQPSYFYNTTINNSSNVQMSKDVYINGVFTPQSGSLVISSNTLTLNGTISNAVINTSEFTGSANSNMVVNGSGSLVGYLYFSSSGRLLKNFILNRTSSGLATLGTDLEVSNAFTFTNGDFSINGNTLKLSGTLNGSGGSFVGSSTSNLTVAGTSGGNLGTLYFKTGSQLLNLLTMDRTGSGSRALLGTSLASNSITLTHGVLVTNSNLLTWNNSGGTLTAPATPWGSSVGSYTDSYIATCDASGTPLSPPLPFTGSVGFRINNVANTETYFPVSQSYLSTPNRMTITNYYTPQAFTVVIVPGDIGNTIPPRVNRIWYVKAALDTASADMKLFFTERDPTLFPSAANDEVETGFDFSEICLVQKNYDPNSSFINLSAGTDIQSFFYGTYAGTEVYAQYSVGVSPDVGGNKDGINKFNRFSIVNPDNIILPVNIINLKAYPQGSTVKVVWTCLNEVNAGYYEVEHSGDARNFALLGSVKALDKGQQYSDYSFTDMLPFTGDNFYRIKSVGKDGAVQYTGVVRVNISSIHSGIAVYPNPVASRHVSVQINNFSEGRYLLQIFNMLGQQVMTGNMEHAGTSSVHTIQLPNNIKAAPYIIRISNGNNVYSQVLIVE